MGTPGKVISHGELIGRAGWLFVQVTVSLHRKRLGDEFWSKPLNLVRGVFDKEVRRKPLTFAADAVISDVDYGY